MADLAARRVAERVRMGGHSIPEVTVRGATGQGFRTSSVYQALADELARLRQLRGGRASARRRPPGDVVTRVCDQEAWERFHAKTK